MVYGHTFNKDGEITGKLTTLRYSAYDTWLKSKDAYRKKYYNGEGFTTAETVFGHEMHKLMQNGRRWRVHPILKNLPRFDVPEKNIVLTLPGNVRIGGRLDSFDPSTQSFIDYKFSHRNKDGKAPWDAVKVARHRQMVFYSILICRKFNRVDPYTRLVWVETAFKKNQVEGFAGHTLESDSRELVLTGEFQVFKRRIAKWEREAMEANIIKVAKEIDEDYHKFYA